MSTDGKIELRAANAADEPFLLALRRSAMAEHHTLLGLNITDADDLARVRYHFDDAQVVCCAGAPIGLFKAFRENGGWVLSQFQLERAFRGRGLGKMLIGELLAKAEAERVPVFLKVLKGNPAQGLYRRLGFEEAETSEYSVSMVWRPEQP